MALWTNYDETQDSLYTTIYFLRDAIESALDHAAHLKETACRKPALIRGAGHAEIAARLSRFRSSFNELRSHEALLVTKLIRAREWAAELKRAAPRIRADAEQFIDATADCETLQCEYVSDPQRLFHGGDLPVRFLEQRQVGFGAVNDSAAPQGQDYRVGGRVDLLELRVACEVFLSQIDQIFFADEKPALKHDETLVPHLQLTDEDMLPPQDEAAPAIH